nr:hypothetical protein [Clostridia bacterium]
MKLKRITAALLCVLMLGSVLASCSDSGNTDAQTTAADAADKEITTATESRREHTPDSLPGDLNFNGAEVNILSRSEDPYGYEMGVEEENGDIVNDTIYQRNLTVEDRLNVKINVKRDITSSSGEDSNAAITKFIAAGDDIYSFCSTYSYWAPSLILDGCFTNINEVPHIDLDKPWWVKNLRDELSMNGNLFMIAGDLTLSLIQYECAIFFNQKLWNDYKIDEDIYALVSDGNWTIDKVAQISSLVSSDVNGDGKFTMDDIYGFGLGDSVNVMALGYGCGMKITEMDKDGIPALVMNSERTHNIISKVQKLFDQESSVHYFDGVLSSDWQQWSPNLQKMFINDQVLLYTGNLFHMESFRDMDSDYGIAPFPKYDESQDSNISNVRDNYSSLVVPKTCVNLELTGAVLEALAAESYRYVTPTYFEVALKNKYSRDAKSAEMIDIVHESVEFNFGLANSYVMKSISHNFQWVFEQKKEFASLYASREVAAEEGLASLIEAYNDID